MFVANDKSKIVMSSTFYPLIAFLGLLYVLPQIAIRIRKECVPSKSKGDLPPMVTLSATYATLKIVIPCEYLPLTLIRYPHNQFRILRFHF